MVVTPIALKDFLSLNSNTVAIAHNSEIWFDLTQKVACGLKIPSITKKGYCLADDIPGGVKGGGNSGSLPSNLKGPGVILIGGVQAGAKERGVAKQSIRNRQS